ncbi:MAG: GGDEF domain-containing protein [Polyangia bacterium]
MTTHRTDVIDPSDAIAFADERTPVTPRMNRIGDPGVKRVCLVQLTGASLGEVIVIDKELVIGRDPTDGLRLPHDRGASREHARIRVLEDGSALLVDMGSTNGTFVDGVRVKERLLVEGDKIRIGQTTVLKYARYDESELSMQRKLVDEALRDGMTRIFNRRYFMDRIEAELGFAERHKLPVALVLFDLDHFKQINDAYGHLAGDRILTEVAAICARTVRHEDVLARYGGEEFIVLLRAIPMDGAMRLAGRLRAAVELAQLCATFDPPRPLTISVGVALLRPEELHPLETAKERLVSAADAALYRAKRGGRNTVCH